MTAAAVHPGGMEPSPSVLGIPPKFMTEWSVLHSFQTCQATEVFPSFIRLLHKYILKVAVDQIPCQVPRAEVR